MKPGDDRETSRRRFLRRVRRPRLRYISILPALITLLNGILGFASLVFASRAVEEIARGNDGMRYFWLSGMMIFFAMIADMLDGRIARMSHTTSSFGGQLDSLCDVISFGAAPAFLMLKLVTQSFSMDETFPLAETLLYRGIWVAAAAYVGCAAIRLARFNVENEEDESSHMSFMGLPSPAAAGVPASLVLLYTDLEGAEALGAFGIWSERTILVMLPVVVFACGVLMVSRFRYPHVMNQYLSGRKPFAMLLKVIVIVVPLLVFMFQVTLAFVFVAFAASGPLRWLYLRYTGGKRLPVPAAGGDQPSDEDELDQQ